MIRFIPMPLKQMMVLTTIAMAWKQVDIRFVFWRGINRRILLDVQLPDTSKRAEALCQQYGYDGLASILDSVRKYAVQNLGMFHNQWCMVKCIRCPIKILLFGQRWYAVHELVWQPSFCQCFSIELCHDGYKRSCGERCLVQSRLLALPVKNDSKFQIFV